MAIGQVAFAQWIGVERSLQILPAILAWQGMDKVTDHISIVLFIFVIWTHRIVE